MRKLGALVLVSLPLLLIAAPTLWKLRQLCELKQESCESWNLLEFVLNDRLALAASVLLAVAMVTLIWTVVRAPTDGSDDEEEISEERKLKLNGNVAALIVFVAYLGASAAILMSTEFDVFLDDPQVANIFAFRVNGPHLRRRSRVPAPLAPQ